MAAVTAAVTVAAVGTAASIRESRKGRAAGRKAAKARAAIARLENQRSIRQQVRDFRIQRGTSLAAAATRGGGGGGFGGVAASGTRGEVAGLRSQLQSNIGFFEEASALGEFASSQEVRAAGAQGRAASFAAVSNLALSAGGLFA